MQNYMLTTMLEHYMETINLPYRIMERSVYSTRLFVELGRKMGSLSKEEYIVLCENFDFHIKHYNPKFDLFGK